MLRCSWCAILCTVHPSSSAALVVVITLRRRRLLSLSSVKSQLSGTRILGYAGRFRNRLMARRNAAAARSDIINPPAQAILISYKKSLVYVITVYAPPRRPSLLELHQQLSMRLLNCKTAARNNKIALNAANVLAARRQPMETAQTNWLVAVPFGDDL